jgi:hypothetical protein
LTDIIEGSFKQIKNILEQNKDEVI